MSISGAKNSKLINHLIAGVLCWFSAEAGLFFVVDQGFGSPVWPAAGIVLGFMLWSKGRLWPSLFIGLVLAYTNFEPDVSLFYSIFQINFQKFPIALTSILQAGITIFVLDRKGLFPNSLVQPKDITKFILYAGVICCLTAATLGNLVLLISGTLPLNGFLFGWFFWWIGDVLGVLIFTPLLVSLLYWKNPLWKFRARFLLPSVGLISIFAVGFFLQFKETNHENIQTRVEGRTNEINWALLDLFENQLEVVNDLGFLFQYRDDVTKEEFETISKHLLKKGNGVFGFSLNQIVKDENRADFEKRMQAVYPGSNSINDRNEDGDLVPAKKANQYSVVTLIYPYDGNETTVGYNLWHLPKRREVMKRAIEQREAQFSETYKLISGINAKIAFYPIFDENDEAKGFATVVVRMDDVAKELISSLNLEGLNVELVDQTDSENHFGILKFNNSKQGKIDKNVGTSLFLIDKNYLMSKSIEVGGRNFVLTVTPTREYIRSLADFSGWIALIILLMATGLFNFVLMVLTGRERTISKLVHARTVELENALSAKSDFLANMSHELRTPLNAIIGFSEIMKVKMFGPIRVKKYEQYIQIINNSGNHLLGIVNDILDLSKVEGNNFELNLDPVSIVNEVEKSVEVMRKMAEEKNLALSLETKIKGEDTIKMDARLFNQMIFNLLGNAIKFTNKGSIKVNLDLLDPHEGETLLVFKVQDTGIGISPENIEKVFDRFERVGATLTKSHEGTGLGLSICKNFVESMGGTINCESRLGKGTCFSLSIPVTRCGFQNELFRP